MDEPKSLDSLFKEKLFRIPDYQRGYAWQREQLKDFWEDLINLTGERKHYTGVLTLKQIPLGTIPSNSKEFWLVDDHSYRVYHVVDGQQRLTTFVIFLKAFVDFVKSLPENAEKPDKDIYISESLSVADLQDTYLFKTKPIGDRFRTYKFGYESDNPSYEYLRFRILGEEGGGSVVETFYTLNLSNAHKYFTGQLRELYDHEGEAGLRQVYKKLTKRFLFNEYVIKDEFDVFVAFETMNNRGRKLSDLELLKNRLIYLTTLYDEGDLDEASKKSLRDAINDAWKEVYHQLGRNRTRPLNDDDFLRAHWIMYFKYSRKTGRDYIHFLLDEQFTPKKVHRQLEREVVLEAPQEVRSEQYVEDAEADDEGLADEAATRSPARLETAEIRAYVNSLKGSAEHWFNSFYPEQATGITDEERQWLDRLNRVGIGYFRPLVLSVLKNEREEAARVDFFKKIERFIFITFRMNSSMANYGSSEFYNAARAFDRKDVSLSQISAKLDERLAYAMTDGQTLRIDDFYNNLFKRFKEGAGYYGWPGIRYFLYEYETSLLSESRQKKVDWDDLLKTEKDKISIEHIYPQTETEEWDRAFEGVEKDHRRFYSASLGNLLLLSMSINASLQNESFASKKSVKINPAGMKIRCGYADGSHSEIEVSNNESWGPEQIRARGIKLLKFMEERWGFSFRNDEEREKLLFINFENSSE